jgi:hypothetical protein
MSSGVVDCGMVGVVTEGTCVEAMLRIGDGTVADVESGTDRLVVGDAEEVPILIVSDPMLFGTAW